MPKGNTDAKARARAQARPARAATRTTELGGRVLRTVRLSDAKARFSALVDEVRTNGEPVVIGLRQKEVAVLIGASEFARLQELDDTIRTARLRQALKGPLRPLEEVLAELDLGL